MTTIQELNETVWCSLAPSKTHGIGVVAIRDIPKGQKLHCYGFRGLYQFKPEEDLNELVPEVRKVIEQRWPLAFEFDFFQHPCADTRLISWMNHSDEPNYDNKTDLALKDIKAGEEVTEDYGKFKPKL